MQMHVIVTATILITNSFPKPKINFCHARGGVGVGCHNRRKIERLILDRMHPKGGGWRIIKLLRINLEPFIFIFSDSLLKVGGTI